MRLTRLFTLTVSLIGILIPGVWLPTPAKAQSPGSFSTLSTTATATLNGDVLMCSGRPWLDVRCNGAVGDDSHDDTSAIQTTINAAIANDWPVHIPAGKYKVTAELTIDYAGQSGSGFRLISEGATIDGRTIASGPVLQVQCSGGTTASPANCFYFKEEGTLFVDADTPAYAVVIGKSDFSDAHNSIKTDHLVVNNASTATAAGGLQLNYVLDADIFAVADSAGGAAGLALEQTQFSRISGAGSANGTGGIALLLENGFNFANTVFAFDMEASPTCLGISFNHDGQNSFVSPYFNCTTAISATASTRNVLINPTYAGNVVNRGPQSVGIQIVGTGSWAQWQFPATASYTAAGVDDKTELVAFATATLTAPYKYNLTYLRRGVYGTPIGAHSNGASFARFGPNDPSLFKYVYPANFVGQTIHVKLPAFNIFGQAMQSLAGLTPTGYTLTGDGAVQGPAYVSGSWAGSPAAGEVVERYIFATPVTFPAGLGGSYGTAGTAATASASFTIAKNGTAIGTMAFAAGAASASFTMSAATGFAAGDVLTIAGPTPADATLANLAWTLAGTL